MPVTPRTFSDALQSAMFVEMPLWLTLNDGRQLPVLLPVSILEEAVAFAGPYVIDRRIVLAWKEIASLRIGDQEAAPLDQVMPARDRLISFVPAARSGGYLISRTFVYRCSETARQLYPLGVKVITAFSKTPSRPQVHEDGLIGASRTYTPSHGGRHSPHAMAAAIAPRVRTCCQSTKRMLARFCQPGCVAELWQKWMIFWQAETSRRQRGGSVWRPRPSGGEARGT
jgi:hypothetical protein